MHSPSYAQNKIHIQKWKQNNKELNQLNRMNSYYRLKNIFHREICSLGRINLSIFQ